MTVLGVDGCKGGWVAIAADDHGYIGGLVESSMERVEAEAVARWGVATIVVDIPIGIPDSTSREADLLARRFIKPRGSSVFPTPVRDALHSPDYASARVASATRSGKSLSAQAYAMRERILDVDSHLDRAQARILEGHPEVSFRAMAGEGIQHSKKSFAGASLRHRLLSDQGIHIPHDLEDQLKPASWDDILDAAAMAWTALRVESGRAQSLPDPPEVFSDGILSTIWY